jgi:hypothetical protein
MLFFAWRIMAMPKEKKAYVAPEIEKREKLGEVAGLPTTVSGTTI